MDLTLSEYEPFEHDAQPIQSSPAPPSSLADAFVMSSAPAGEMSVAHDSDMGPMGGAEEWSALQPDDGADEAMAMMQDAYDGEGAQQEITMQEYASTEDDTENDGTMADADDVDAVDADDVPQVEIAEAAEEVEPKAMEGENDPRAGAEYAHTYEETLNEPEPATEGDEQQPAFIAASTASTNEPEVPAEIVSEQAQLQEPQAAASAEQGGIETKNSSSEVQQEETREAAIASSHSDDDAGKAAEAAHADLEHDEQVEITQPQQASEHGSEAVAKAVETSGAPTEVATLTQKSSSDAAQEAAQDASSDTEVPLPVRVTFNGQDFVLFPRGEDASYLVARGAAVSGQGGEMPASQSATLEAVSAPKLAASTEVYYDSLDALFEALRVQESLGDFLDEGTELRLNFVDLGMEVREDDVYAREVTLDDISRLHDGLGYPGSLHVIVQEGKRFISRYNELATHVASLLEGAAESDEGDDSLTAPKEQAIDQNVEEGVAPVKSANADASAASGAEGPENHGASDEGHGAIDDDQPAGVDEAELKANETFTTVGEKTVDQLGTAEGLDSENGQAGATEEEEEYEDAGEDSYEPYDETHYDNANEEQVEDGDATQYEPAEDHDDDQEQLVEYEEAYEEADGEEKQALATNGQSDDTEADATEDYVEVKSPSSHKRSLDTSYDEDEHGVYSEAEGTNAEGTSDLKRVRYEADEA